MNVPGVVVVVCSHVCNCITLMHATIVSKCGPVHLFAQVTRACFLYFNLCVCAHVCACACVRV